MHLQTICNDFLDKGVGNYPINYPSHYPVCQGYQDFSSVYLIPSLPNEIAVKIFTYFSPKELKIATQVCQLWRSHAFNLWQQGNFSANLSFPGKEPGFFAYVHSKRADRAIAQGSCLPSHFILSNASFWECYENHVRQSVLKGDQLIHVISNGLVSSIAMSSIDNLKQLTLLSEEEEIVHCLSASGSQMVTFSECDNWLQGECYFYKVWDLNNVKLVAFYENSHLFAEALAIEEDKLIIATAHFVKILNLETFQEIQSIDNPLGCSKLTVEQGKIIIGTKEGKVVIWNLHTYQMMAQWQAHDQAVADLKMAGDKLISSNGLGQIKIWQATQATQAGQANSCLHEIQGYIATNTCMAVAGDKLILAPLDQPLEVWDLNTYRQIGFLTNPLHLNSDQTLRHLNVTSDQILAVQGMTLIQWDLSENHSLSLQQRLSLSIDGLCQKLFRLFSPFHKI